MRKNSYLIMFGVLAAFAVMAIVGCGGPNNTDDSSGEIATVAEPNQDGYAGNSHVEYEYLGKAIDPQTGREVEGYAIIHYAPGFTPPRGRELAAKPPWAGGGGGGGGGGDEPTCYAFIAEGYKWRQKYGWNEDWYLDVASFPAGAPWGDMTLALAILNGSVDDWENAAGKVMLGDGDLGDPVLDSYNAGGPSLDTKNVVYYGNYPQSGVIAVTYTWGVWRGKTSKRYIAEWDQLYDSDWNWSVTTGAPASGTMDFWNIAKHELGHSIGLGHPSEAGCEAVTMWATAPIAETDKRSLEPGDEDGAHALYN